VLATAIIDRSTIAFIIPCNTRICFIGVPPS
jgi:hypothetical protein